MHYTPLVVLALGALAQANLIKRDGHSNSSAAGDYFDQVCLPADAKDHPDFNAPCWQIQTIEDECIYGNEFTFNITTRNSTTYGTMYAVLAPRDQQRCLCNSQYWQALGGCVACAKGHGITGAIPDIPQSAISSFSASYCAASYTATADLATALYTGFASYITSSHSSATATTFSDPIGNKTEVSLYWTASATATAAQSGSTTASRTGSGASALATSTGAAVAGAVVDKLAVAGMMGFAAVVAAL